MSCSDIFLGIIAILFPPIAVWIKSGVCSADSCINILLCVLGYVPGLIHAWYIIAKYPEVDHDYEPIDSEAGRSQRVTYYYVSHEGGGAGGNNASRQTRGGYGGVGTNGQGLPPRLPGNKPNHGSQQQQSGNVAAGAAAGSSRQPAGSDEQGAPPSYSEVVRGDNKIQSQS